MPIDHQSYNGPIVKLDNQRGPYLNTPNAPTPLTASHPHVLSVKYPLKDKCDRSGRQPSEMVVPD